MADQIIPLDNSPNQSFTIPLAVDGATLTLQLAITFNEMANYWVMAIADASGNPLLSSVPLLTGSYPASNILEQHAYLKIGSAYVINASGTTKDYPDKTSLGTDFYLLWSDTPE